MGVGRLRPVAAADPPIIEAENADHDTPQGGGNVDYAVASAIGLALRLAVASDFHGVLVAAEIDGEGPVHLGHGASHDHRPAGGVSLDDVESIARRECSDLVDIPLRGAVEARKLVTCDALALGRRRSQKGVVIRRWRPIRSAAKHDGNGKDLSGIRGAETRGTWRWMTLAAIERNIRIGNWSIRHHRSPRQFTIREPIMARLPVSRSGNTAPSMQGL